MHIPEKRLPLCLKRVDIIFPTVKQVGNERGTANLEQQKEHLFT